MPRMLPWAIFIRQGIDYVCLAFRHMVPYLRKRPESLA